MRALLILILLHATARAQPAPTAARPLDGWVTDADGPVAGAELRVVAHRKAPCPCEPRVDDTTYDSTPDCACPAALASYRQRLASCRWPQPARATMRSDAQGHFSLGRAALGGILEVTTEHGVQWMVPPPGADRLAIELEAPVTPRLSLSSGVAIRAALLYEDGHCMPFRRVGATNVWATVAPVPADQTEKTSVVLIVEANGFATVMEPWTLFTPPLVLQRATPVRGTCTGNRVELDNPFQHLVATGARARHFAFTGVVATKSRVRCLRDGDVLNDWYHLHDEGLQENSPAIHLDEHCSEVQVVDRAGRPIAGAAVRSETIGYTDSRGVACLEHVFAGGELIAHAPDDQGGECAGTAKVTVTGPLRVVLDVRPLPRSRWRGRVLSPERHPVVGAYVTVSDLEPAATPGCTTGYGWNLLHEVRTGPDGRFELPLLPQGTLTLEISHDWYASREFPITLPSAEQEFQLERGMTWNGRVLDPDGKVLDRCDVSLMLADARLITGTCSAQGFSLRTLVPGKAKLSITVEHHALGTLRRLVQTIELKPGKLLVEDVRWPRGETIAGRVLDPSGAPIAGARLTALPKGVLPAVDRLQDNGVMLEADDQGRFTFRHLAPGAWTIQGDLRASKQTTQDLATGTTNVRFVTSR